MSWRDFIYRTIAAEVSATTRYADRVTQWRPLPHDDGLLLRYVDAPGKQSATEPHELQPPRDPHDHRETVLLNGNINDSLDIQGLLSELRPHLSRHARLVVVTYNPYLRWVYALASRFGVRRGPLPVTFVTRTDLENVASLGGFEVVRVRPVLYSPLRLGGLGVLLNVLLPIVPLLRWLAFVNVIHLRPAAPMEDHPSLSIVIPARNERGNIGAALRRLPPFPGTRVEVIFVEGHSSDGTWEEIQRVKKEWDGRNGVTIKAFQQTGKGKSDAVRLGFAQATGDLLTILDADLTVEPELLGRFYDAYRRGLGDFVNGSRLVYPYEADAMRFLNRLGNVFFAKALSWLLDARLGDALCGTKLFNRRDYQRFTAWRNDFGDVDPFGDFELLFPAATLGLGVIDVPIHYRTRTYGSTQISRFRHGLMLLRMTWIGLLRIKLGRPPQRRVTDRVPA